MPPFSRMSFSLIPAAFFRSSFSFAEIFPAGSHFPSRKSFVTIARTPKRRPRPVAPVRASMPIRGFPVICAAFTSSR